MREELYLDLGVPFPGVHVRYDGQLPDNSYAIAVREICVARGVVPPQHICLIGHTHTLDVLGIPYLCGAAVITGHDSAWVEDQYRHDLRHAALPVLDNLQLLVLHLSTAARRHVADFLGLQETRFLLDHTERDFPSLVSEIQQVLPIQKITEVLKRLVAENISIRDLRMVLETMVNCAQMEKDPAMVTEYVRAGLSRQISHQVSGGRQVVPAYLLDPALETAIRDGIRQTPQGSFLALDPGLTQRLTGQVKQMAGDIHQRLHKPVLITAIDVRRFVRKLLEAELRDLPVLSHQELTPNLTIQLIDQVRLPG